jgi:hypothetical protein
MARNAIEDRHSLEAQLLGDDAQALLIRAIELGDGDLNTVTEHVRVVQRAEVILQRLQLREQGRGASHVFGWLEQISQSFGRDARRVRLRFVVGRAHSI